MATGFLRNSMINEEGGIDPEQFRMEAMFDRMDAIGKGVLGLTIQCAQCHNHKFDPITQEEYYRLFAFLNNSHEGSRAVYTPDEQKQRAEILRGTREIEAELQHTTPDWAERLAAWEESVRGRAARVDGRAADRRGHLDRRRSATCPSPTARSSPLGYAPTKHRVKLTAKIEADGDHGLSARAAERPEPAARRPGPLARRHRRAHRVRGRDRAGRRGSGREAGQGEARERDRRRQSAARRCWTPIFDDKSEPAPRDRARSAFAIDGKDETAWGIDVGPGPAQRAAQGRLRGRVARSGSRRAPGCTST